MVERRLDFILDLELQEEKRNSFLRIDVYSRGFREFFLRPLEDGDKNQSHLGILGKRNILEREWGVDDIEFFLADYGKRLNEASLPVGVIEFPFLVMEIKVTWLGPEDVEKKDEFWRKSLEGRVNPDVLKKIGEIYEEKMRDLEVASLLQYLEFLDKTRGKYGDYPGKKFREDSDLIVIAGILYGLGEWAKKLPSFEWVGLAVLFFGAFTILKNKMLDWQKRRVGFSLLESSLDSGMKRFYLLKSLFILRGALEIQRVVDSPYKYNYKGLLCDECISATEEIEEMVEKIEGAISVVKALDSGYF